jgi:pheromone shutdown protein TraB
MKKIFTILWAMAILYGLQASIVFAEVKEPNEAPKTRVVIIGTIHSNHHKNPKYSPDILKGIILALKPDAILNELPLSLVDPNGRPIEKIRGRESNWPDIWSADQAAQELGIKQIPFDRPDREENFKKTNFVKRQNQSTKLANKWGKEVAKEEPNSLDIKISQLCSYSAQAEDQLSERGDPEIINSEARDSVVRIKNSLWYEIMPEILKKYPDYQTLIDGYHFTRDEWYERNRIMVANIIKAAKKYPGKRLVVVTGATHRYILRDLLKDEPCIDLKEYWEIIGPNITKSKVDDLVKEDIQLKRKETERAEK